MARKDRTGNRKTRENVSKRHIPALGYYVVVTDTEATERLYFEGLWQSLPEEAKHKLVIKVIETNTKNLIKNCLEEISYDPQYRVPWIVFDRDKVKDFDDIIEKAKENRIHVGWSNPCFEIWLFAYFGSMPNIYESKICCNKFAENYKRMTKREYAKGDKDLYKQMKAKGNEEKALIIAENKHNEFLRDKKNIPSEMCPCTTVYKLVGEILNKCNP